MKLSLRAGTNIILGVVIGLAISLSYGVFAGRGNDHNFLPLDELRTFSDIYVRIKQSYVEEVDGRELMENAIRGMLSGLDPHSSYLGEDEYRELQMGTRGVFGGIGIEVGMEDGFIKVISPIDDTPASRAGVQAGDLIIRLDDTPVKGLSLSEAVNLMRGEKGTSITLTIVREGEEGTLRLAIERDIIQVRSVRSELLEPGFPYVRISNFQAKTAQDLVKVLDGYMKEDGGIRGIVLDLRNNPGGILTGAVGVTDALLDGGLIVYTEGRIPDSQQSFSASPGDVIDGATMVVLVNEGSASASEIVAGALQDHRRAVVMGAPTFGKGSVQTIMPVSDRTALKLTTARYYTPHGRSIQAEGIEPDIRLERVKIQRADQDDDRKPTKEADLQRHLDNGPNEGPAEKRRFEDGKVSDLPGRDYAVGQALNLLKGLDIMRSGGN